MNDVDDSNCCSCQCFWQPAKIYKKKSTQYAKFHFYLSFSPSRFSLSRGITLPNNRPTQTIYFVFYIVEWQKGSLNRRMKLVVYRLTFDVFAYKTHSFSIHHTATSVNDCCCFQMQISNYCAAQTTIIIIITKELL